MEPQKTIPFDNPTEFEGVEITGSDRDAAERRLTTLLKVNADFVRKNSRYDSFEDQLEAELMVNPISSEKAFGYFGALLGSFPPASFFARFLFETDPFSRGDGWITILLLVVTIVTALTGYFSGKLIGKVVTSLEKYPWWAMIFLLPFVGFLWGMISGAAGGFFIFIIGAVFGAAIGGAVGAIALPVFAVFHRILKRGDQIEQKEFLPIAFGITLTISALILGLPV